MTQDEKQFTLRLNIARATKAFHFITRSDKVKIGLRQRANLFKKKMSQATLADLPSAPKGKTGWPWTEHSEPLPATQPDGTPWPIISIVTPSYNQGKFIEKTIRSVLLQGYPNLEYIVMDGGSDDESVEIIQRYDAWIDYWISESDRGQSHAINKGFDKSEGKFGSWINSDDWLCKNALTRHAKDIGFEDDVLYVGICNAYKDGTKYQTVSTNIRSIEDLVKISDFWCAFYLGQESIPRYITQPETLFPLKYFRKVGGLNEENHFAMDYELWGDLLIAGVKIIKTDVEYGVIRRHEQQKSNDRNESIKSLIQSAHRLIEKNSKWSSDKKEVLHEEVDSHYEKEKNVDQIRFKNSGRLANIGLPPIVVRLLRKLKKTVIRN